MKTSISTLRLALLCCALFCSLPTALAQDENKPLALLRKDPSGTTFSIKVQTNVTFSAGSKLSAILSNKNSLVAWQESVLDCGAREPEKFCKRYDAAQQLELYFPLAAKPGRDDKFKVSFAITGENGRGSFRTAEVLVDALPDLKVVGPTTDLDCVNGLRVEVRADTTELPEGDAADFYRARYEALAAWLKANKSSPQAMARVQIEPLNKSAMSEYTVQSFSVSPGLGGGNKAQDLDADAAFGTQRVGVCLSFAKELPSGKFNAQVEFKNDPPVELQRLGPKTLSGPKDMGAPTAQNIPDENKLDLRSFENNLNLGMLYTSSVKDTKVGSKTVHQRQSRAALDLRFAPLWRNRMRPPEVRKWQPFWTPIFVDAKVSTGSISSDSLSLNRILVGSEVAFRYYQSTERGKRNKYIFNFRGVNASDRDYKRAELDGTVDFTPIFNVINKPLNLRRVERSQLIPDGPRKELPLDRWFGYEIQPFIGFDLGKVYRRHRSTFKNEELGNMVRRLRIGAELKFSLGPSVNLRLTDTFFLRGNVKGSGHTRNYFSGTAEVPLGNRASNYAQCLFFSFERGDQPPFSSASVNALKFGYRLRSDFFGAGNTSK